MPIYKRYTPLFLTFFIGQIAFAQSLSLSQLFYPNITLHADYQPNASLNASTKYGLSRNQILGILPLKTEINAGFGIGRKADIEAKHTVLIANLGQITPTLNDIPQQENGYKTATLGIVQLKASLRDRFWIYAGGLGITESAETFFKPQPYLFGGAARMRILGAKTQIFYGTALIFSQKFRLIPIFGFTKTLGQDWKISGILPFRASVAYKAQPWLSLEGNAVIDGYSAGYQNIINSQKLIERQNLQQIRFSVSANAHLLKVFNIAAEVGITGLRQLRTFSPLISVYNQQNPSPAPYLGLSVRYISSKSKMSSKFLGKMGL